MNEPRACTEAGRELIIQTNDELIAAAGRELIIQTNDELIAARHAYYVLNKPILSDAQYDASEKNLKGMVEQMPQFKRLATILYTVGSDMVHSSGRIRHITPMLSLENKYDFDELREWCLQFSDQQFVIEPKVDGASCSLLYLNRQLVKAVSRGDGLYGEDVTKQMAASGAVPLTLPEQSFPSTPVEIRGEVFISTQQFDKLNAELVAADEKPYASPRNLAAGSMKLLDLEAVKLRGLKFFVWQVEGVPQEYLEKRNLDAKYAHHTIQYVTKQCPQFPASILVTAQDWETVERLIDGQIRKEREVLWHKGLGMQTDGVVIKLVSPAARKEAGSTGKYPDWACCFKFQNLGGMTTLRAVEWQTGRTGVLTPVGILEPITLGGAVISRVSLNNWSWMQEMGITHLPCEVELVRSGDVIPKILRVGLTGISKPISPPLYCACGHQVTPITDPKSGVTQHWCDNMYCEAKLKARLEYVAGRTVLEIDELGPELIEKLVSGEYVVCLSDLFSFANDLNQWPVPEEGKDRVGAATRKMAKSVKAAKTRDWDKWIAALDMPNIGRSLGKVLAMQCRLQPDDLPNLRSILTKTFTEEKIDGIGDIRKAELLDYFAKHGDWFDEELGALYQAGVRPLALIQAATGGSQPLTGYIMCITGEFSEDREKLSAKLSILGATMKTGVSKKLTHLLVGEGAGRSKLAKAVELNIPKLDCKWLETTLEANGMKLEKSGFDAEWDEGDFA